MEQLAAEALYEAEQRGVRQIRGALSDNADGLCALGVLFRAGLGQPQAEVDGCSVCGAKRGPLLPINYEFRLISHLNDDHGLTFSEIARKLGPDTT